MPRPFHRTFIAGVAAAAVLITAIGTSQASAGNRDTERALAALLGLAVIGAIIADRRNDDRNAPVVTRNRQYHGISPRPLPRRAQRHLLPRECLREVRTGRGYVRRVYGGRCMNQHYAYADSLPRHCARNLHGHRGVGHATVWGAYCLEQHGYRHSHR